jgi:hypothetical protein
VLFGVVRDDLAAVAVAHAQPAVVAQHLVPVARLDGYTWGQLNEAIDRINEHMRWVTQALTAIAVAPGPTIQQDWKGVCRRRGLFRADDPAS